MTKEIIIFYLLYLGLNLFNAFIITHQVLNKYIVPFKHTFKGETNAIIGNLFTLNLIGLLILLFSKNLYLFLLVLVVFTGVINLLLFAINVFNLYFGTAFTKECVDMFKNPVKGMSKGILKEILNELFGYYRIILFFPFMLLFLLFIVFNKSEMSQILIPINNFSILSIISFSVLMIIFAWSNYKKMYLKDLAVKAAESTYGIQNYGIYSFYLSSLFSFASIPDLLLKTKKKNFSALIKDYNLYNKNIVNYTNFINNEVYSNNLKLNMISEGITVDKSLINEEQSLSGILAGKHLVLVQMESMSRFLLDIPILKKDFPFLRTILEESVDFTEFYSSVGMGVSSDAEVTTLTGLYGTGYNSLYWSKFDFLKKYYKDKKELNALPKYFNNNGYYSEAVHGDYKQFYNREYAYPEIMGFQNFIGLNDFKNKKSCNRDGIVNMFSYEYSKGKNHISPWISDYQLADSIRNKIRTFKKSTFLFPITMMPHTPFEYYPQKNKKYITKYGLKDLTKKYLRFADYYDGVIKRFFTGKNDCMEIDSNSVYLFYGDHGCGIKNGDLSKLFHSNLSKLEERRFLQQLVCFLYVPGKKEKVQNGFVVKEGLIKGNQDLVRGQMDIYRTIIELFGLETNQNAYFGTHLLSKEPTFVLDNRLQDVIFDKLIFSMRNRNQTYPLNKSIDNKWYEYIKNFKILNDILIEEDGIQTKLNEAILKH
ncbi:MAG: LTA synthase family protein [Promethearchaeota archaeon]